ncbi:sugar-binding transcriptional regulator [Marinivivus vitaminiproducens]|uniref:sugar-binding transcriptional regulator n=1 Tax=Marinivivus vitaminiproducens TaxID=3035935 RepID=UPI0027AB30E2|nr:sugar-binding transcriptional regulator [Geminicoccaceae bacterium SCSIO 64248]
MEGLDTQARKRLDLAARAAWLYYIQGKTQDEIAGEIGISRQNVQRLVALAQTERLIKFRLDHELAGCLDLEKRLRDRFELVVCKVIPGESEHDENRTGVGIGAAEILEGFLAQKAPVTLAIGTGRALREAVRQMPAMSRPQHRIVSLIGNITRDGRASPYDVAIRLADRVEAACYPLPTPVVTDTEDERERVQQQRGYQTIRHLVDEAKAHIMGIGRVDWGSPLHADGFITESELADVMERGAVGEMRGWTFNAAGEVLSGGFLDRLTAMPLEPANSRTALVAGAGRGKVPAIRAALRGRLANALVTDEATARAVLALA